MPHLKTTPHSHNFVPLHSAMQRYVDGEILAGVSSAVLRGRDVLDVHCAGWADKERGELLRTDHLFRIFSNTKLVTTCAVLLLMDDGKLRLDDSIEPLLPELADRQVLKVGATRIYDTEPARRAITFRHLLTHTSGLSYGLLDPGTLIYKAYLGAKVLRPSHTLAGMVAALSALPLVCHPGEGWEYSVATDVLARLVEIVSGQRFDAFVHARIFAPLGMADTGFVVPPEQGHRLTTNYKGADLLNPSVPGLRPDDGIPFNRDYTQSVALLSGGGGLVSTLSDMVALLQSLLPGGPTLLKPSTLSLMVQNHLPDGRCIRFAGLGDIVGKGFGLGGAVTLKPSSIDPPASSGEFQWGGLAGTHWWISPRTSLAGVLMTQRHMGFWNPYSFELKRLVYQVAGH
jgi:CubicO group peptidase (beta-lactamase class C family)